MGFILFSDHSQADLYPLTLTRPLFQLRCGIFTMKEKWEKALDHPVQTSSPGYLGPLFDHLEHQHGDIWINGKFYPMPDLVREIREITSPGSILVNETGEVLAFRFDHNEPKGFHGIRSSDDLDQLKERLQPFPIHTAKYPAIRFPWDLFMHNREFILMDFSFLDRKEAGKIKDKNTVVYGADNVYIEAGFDSRAAIINAEDGPVYLGRNVKLQEGSIIHSSHALLDNCVISMGAKLRGDSTFGPGCKIGGEVANSVIQGFSNKAHDGYMGNSVLGEWCNLGADTNTSNLKNNYTPVRVWNYRQEKFADTGTIFCGLIMGDHSKCGINTMFNTGTVAGVGCNIFGSGYPRNFIPDFSWGGKEGTITHQLAKVFETEEIVMSRRGLKLDGKHKEMLNQVFEMTKKNRGWEKN